MAMGLAWNRDWVYHGSVPMQGETERVAYKGCGGSEIPGTWLGPLTHKSCGCHGAH